MYRMIQKACRDFCARKETGKDGFGAPVHPFSAFNNLTSEFLIGDSPPLKLLHISACHGTFKRVRKCQDITKNVQCLVKMPTLPIAFAKHVTLRLKLLFQKIKSDA